MDTAVPRTLARTLTTLTSSMLLLVLTALPALAAAGTKPDPDTYPYLIGSMGQLITTAIVGIAVGIVGYAQLPKAAPEDTADDHH
jgi:hypothetical protein